MSFRFQVSGFKPPESPGFLKLETWNLKPRPKAATGAEFRAIQRPLLGARCEKAGPMGPVAGHLARAFDRRRSLRERRSRGFKPGLSTRLNAGLRPAPPIGPLTSASPAALPGGGAVSRR